MRKTNKLLAGLISLSLAVSVSAMPALAADGDTSSTEPTTYVVTFRPGEHGRFTDSFIDGLKTCGEVRTSEATGAVAVQLDEGDPLPNAPQLTDIVMNEDASRYFVTDAAQGYTGGTAGGDLDAVAQYTLRASTEDAVFTVQYLDRETGAEVAPTLQGSAPVGQNLTFYALNNIENYTAEVASQQLTVSANADENVVTFYYTAGVNNVTETVTVPGGTITEYEDQTVVGGAAVAGGGAGGAGQHRDRQPLPPQRGQVFQQRGHLAAPGGQAVAGHVDHRLQRLVGQAAGKVFSQYRAAAPGLGVQPAGFGVELVQSGAERAVLKQTTQLFIAAVGGRAVSLPDRGRFLD